MHQDKWHSKKYKNRSEMQKASWTEERKHKQGKAHSNVMKELWADPVYRKKMMKVRKEQVTLEIKERLSEIVTKHWKDNYEKMCKARRKQATPERNKANSKRVTELWEDSDYYAKQMKTRNKTMYNNPRWLKHITAANRKLRLGKPGWNKGKTKYDTPSLMSASKKLQGRLPDYNKYKCWYPCEKDQQIEMRCSWEVAFALWMDDHGIEWEYQTKKFFVGRGKWLGETYTPDFYLPNQKLFIELKGPYNKANKRKMKRFFKWYPEVKLYLLFRNHLKKIIAHYKVLEKKKAYKKKAG